MTRWLVLLSCGCVACSARVGFERRLPDGDRGPSPGDPTTRGDGVGSDPAGGADAAGDATAPGDATPTDSATPGDAGPILATAVYRSVGSGNTAPLATGTANPLMISGFAATFATQLPATVGVGDVIQYDCNNSGAVNRLAVITGRLDATHLKVFDAGTAAPSPTTTNDNRWSIYRAYTSLYDALRGAENPGIAAALRDFDAWSNGVDLVTPSLSWNIACYADGADLVTGTTEPTTAGWTTDAARFLRIYAPKDATEVGVTQRHVGVFDRQKYYLHRGDPGDLLRVDGTRAIRIEGLQFWHAATVGPAYAIHVVNLPDGSEQWLNANIIEGNPANLDSVVDAVHWEGGTNVTVRTWNNLVMSGWRGAFVVMDIATGQMLAYNNTVVGPAAVQGSWSASWPVQVTVKNNIDAGVGCSGGQFTVDCTRNTCASNNTPFDLPEAAVIFGDPASGRFNLAGIDTVARGAGVDLSADPELSFSDDITGAVRTGPWSIGAFQSAGGSAPVAIYRSVGPTRTTPVVASGSSTLVVWPALLQVDSGPLFPANVGVGDALVYDATSAGSVNAIAFISAVIEAGTVYQLSSATGSGVVGATHPGTWAVYRAYTGLNTAVGSWGHGNANSGIPAALRSFDNLGSGKDLVTANVTWNIACYADAVDNISASQIHLDGAAWLTSATHTLRIFAPSEPQEVGVSQRHSGVYDPSRYAVYNTTASVAALISIEPSNVRVDGLQVFDDVVGSTNIAIELWMNGGGDAQVSHSVLKGNGAGAGSAAGLAISGPANGTVEIWDNVLIDWNRAAILDNTNSGVTGLVAVSNNTIYGSPDGISTNWKTFFGVNNLVQGVSATCYHGSGWSAFSDYNVCNLAETAVGPHSKSVVSASFVDVPTRNLRLNDLDSVAHGAGRDLSRDPNLVFDDNIAGELRTSPWSIGAF